MVQGVHSVPKQQLVEDWVFWVLFIALAVLAWTNVANGLWVRQLYNGLMAPRLVKQVLREEAGLANWGTIGLMTVFVLVGSMFLYQFDLLFGWKVFGPPGLLSYLQYAGVLAGLYTLKPLSVECFKFIINGDFGLSEYLFTVFLVNIALGVLLFPIVVGGIYLKGVPSLDVLYVGLGIIGLGFLYRFARGLKLGFDQKVSKFHLFLYLCTLEFVPLVVLIKVFVSSIE